MPCTCEKKCANRAAMRLRHGTPAAFAAAVDVAYCDGYCGDDYAGCMAAVDKYCREYADAPEPDVTVSAGPRTL